MICDYINLLTTNFQLLAGTQYEAQQMEKDLDYVDRLHRECVALKDKISSLGSRLVSSYSKVNLRCDVILRRNFVHAKMDANRYCADILCSQF